MTKPTKCVCAQRRLRSESSLCAKWVAKDPSFGRTLILLALSCRGSFYVAYVATEANMFYDYSTHQFYDAPLLTRCYTQHALRPYIDSEINHKRYFIKIPFINKRIEFIGLPSIFKDKSVNSAILAYFKNTETPIIWYTYNKSISSTRFIPEIQ